MIYKIMKLAFVAMALVVCNACNDDDMDYKELDFIGDSLVARWDLQEYFPTEVVNNYGISGSGVEYLESMKGKFQGKTMVVISGTNDLHLIDADNSDSIEDYARRYLAAIESFGARKVFLYCIFPHGNQFGGSRESSRIKRINQVISDMVEKDHPDIQYLDVYDDLLYDGILNPNYSMDGLHLNLYGYEVISAALQQQL